MKKAALLALFIASPALAQQSPQDPKLSVCQQLLANANSQVINIAGESSTLSKQVEDLKAELAKLKNESPKEK